MANQQPVIFIEVPSIKQIKYTESARSIQSKNSNLFFETSSEYEGISLLKKIPFFILFMTGIEMMVYYGADDRLKRALLYDTQKKKEIWRFVSYMLLHTDGVHLGINIIIQGLIGIPLEFEQGRVRCALIYFGGGLAGSLGASVFLPFSLMAGASGGVYALLMAHIPNVVLNYKAIKYASYRVIIVAVLTASDIIYIFFHVYLFNNEKPQIGWAAHASGAAAGVLLGFLFFSGTFKWRRKFQVTSGVLLVLLFVIIIFCCYNSYSFVL